MKNIACSKFWTDLNIRGNLQQVTHCCRRTYFDIDNDVIDQYQENLFNNHPLILDERKRMIATNKLTEGCKSCELSWPNSDWHSWNEWQDKDWAEEELENLKTEDKISRIEISFSNKCNFSCMYCSYHYSSTWAKLTNNLIKSDESWTEKIIDALYHYIDVEKTYKFGFIGGEPLLDLEVLTNIEKLISRIHLNPSNEIYIITNLGVKEKTLRNFLNITEKYPAINWRISVSIDSIQKNGEIIRDGLNLETFLKNLNLVVATNSIKKLTFLPTISALNVSTLEDTIQWMLDQKKIIENRSDISVGIGTGAVVDPIAMSPSILPTKYRSYVDKTIKLLGTNLKDFTRHLRTVKNKIGTDRTVKNLELARQWYEQQGRIKNKDYFSLFPELVDILDVDKVVE